nr:NADH dehydrogenase subunit 5 [Artheneis intricata]
MINRYNFFGSLLLFMGFSIFFSGVYFLYLNLIILIDWEFFSLNTSCFVMTFLFDWMSLLFVGSVMLISSMIIYYSGSYMYSDVNNYRFLLLVLMFVLSMCMMVLSPNLVSILLGWDGLGLVSYCLVVYFQNFKSYNAGMLTILMNRIGDVAILLGIGLMFNLGGWHFLYYFDEGYITYLISLLVILAGFTKSAQIPFSSWLPAAMAAPTPVSALVHSSTLVTAGVYLLIRFSEIIFSYDLSFFLLLSTLTMFMSGLCAVSEYDLKKVIALSTLSQLGMMMSILFMGYPLASFFHLLTHAFFKALLFLCAGMIIHCVNDNQDIRYMGGLSSFIPCTMICFCISNMSLCGLPFMSGFYSKDLILELSVVNYYNLFIYLLFYISVGLTVCYSSRLVYFCVVYHMGLYTYCNFSEDFKMITSMIFLSFMSLVSGSMLSWFLFPFPNFILIPLYLKLMPIMILFLGVIMGFELSFLSFTYLSSSNLLFYFLGEMWFMPFFSTYGMYKGGLYLSNSYFNLINSGWGEYLVSKSLSLFLIMFFKFITFFQYNNLKVYYSIFGLLAFLLIML